MIRCSSKRLFVASSPSAAASPPRSPLSPLSPSSLAGSTSSFPLSASPASSPVSSPQSSPTRGTPTVAAAAAAVAHCARVGVAATAFARIEAQTVRSVRLDRVAEQVGATDIVLARQDTNKYSFMGFRGIASGDVAGAMLLLPESHRHFHTVCARPGSPCDFYADIDLPLDADPERVLLDVTGALADALRATKATRGAGDASLRLRIGDIGRADDPEAAAVSFLRAVGGADALPGSFFSCSAQISEIAHELREQHFFDMRAARSGTAAEEDDATEAAEFDDGDGEEAVSGPTSSGAFGDLDVVILRSPSLHKHSFHLHTRSRAGGCCFRDFRDVGVLAAHINKAVGRPAIDLACYRPNGMLRTAFSSKLVPAGNRGVGGGVAAVDAGNFLQPYSPRDSELRRRAASQFDMAPRDIFDMSLVTRQAPEQGKLRLAAVQAAGATSADHAPEGAARLARSDRAIAARYPELVKASGKKPKRPFLRDEVKWLRFSQACAALEKAPPAAAADYLTWISVGLALRSFGDAPNILERWIAFSAKASSKFTRAECVRRWRKLGHGGRGGAAADDWRRGYGFLTRKLAAQQQS